MGSFWRKSGQFEFDANGERAAGAKAYFTMGGTTTVMTVYSDAALTSAHSNPVVANGVGRWPAVYIPFIVSYDELITDAADTQLTHYTQISNIDPTDTLASTVNATQIYKVGDWSFSDVDETKPGWVRCNGRTIGSAASGASERANPDCEDLFIYRWNKIADGQAPVFGGRGASAAADWAANKTITLADNRGGNPLGLDNMGSIAANVLGAVPFINGNSTTPGSLVGENVHTLLTVELPVHTPAGTISQITPAGTISQITPAGTVTKPDVTITDPGHVHPGGDLYDAQTAGNFDSGVAGGVGAVNNSGAGNTASNTTGITAELSATPVFAGTPVIPTFSGTPVVPTFVGVSIGSGTAHNLVAKSVLGTWYQKL